MLLTVPVCLSSSEAFPLRVEKEARTYDSITADPQTGETDIFDKVVYSQVVRRRELSILNRVLDTVEAGTILEVGCGPGWLCKYLSNRGYSVIGLDVSRNMLTNARASAPHTRAFVVADTSNLPFAENSIGCVVSIGALHHLDVRKAFNSFSYVCPTGGMLIAFEPNRLNAVAGVGRWLFPTEAHTPNEKQFSPSELASITTDAGWQVIEQGTLIHLAFVVSRTFSKVLGNAGGSRGQVIAWIVDGLESFAESLIPLAQYGWIAYLVARKV